MCMCMCMYVYGQAARSSCPFVYNGSPPTCLSPRPHSGGSRNLTRGARSRCASHSIPVHV